MYRRYYNEYEKKAQQIKNQASSNQLPHTSSQETKKEIINSNNQSLSHMKFDDILILGLIFFLIKEGTADKTLILALSFIFMSGF